MGPRPTRRGAAATAGGLSPPSGTKTAARPVAPVGAPSPRRAAAIPTGSAPADLRRALSGIVAQLRNVPRAIIGDPAEVVHFLNRQARALERVRDMPIALPSSPQATPRTSAPTPALPSPLRTLSARERAEAIFRSPGDPSGPTAAPTSPQAAAEAVFRGGTAALPRPRIVVDRKGRGVRVEVRRAREAGQLEMPV